MRLPSWHVFYQNHDTIDEDVDSNESTLGWIQWFCQLRDHEFLTEVDDEYIRDSFNLCGLKSKIKNFDLALEMILAIEPPDSEEIVDLKVIELYKDAADLYGLIHARFILSQMGLCLMKFKYLAGQFGSCPRVLCRKQKVLPSGLSDEFRAHRVRLYCPRCQECFDCKADLDGAYFGTSFAGLFLQTFPDLVPRSIPIPYVPKIFGFQIYNKKSVIQHKIDQKEYGFNAQREFGSRRPAVAVPNHQNLKQVSKKNNTSDDDDDNDDNDDDDDDGDDDEDDINNNQIFDSSDSPIKPVSPADWRGCVSINLQPAL